MKAKVVYYTKSGNTEKIAKAIAQELDCEITTMDETPTTAVDILFLGASVYKFGIDKKVLNFIANLDNTKIGTVVIFSTSAMSDSGYPQLVKKIAAKGIKVSEHHYYCRGQFMFANKNKPDLDDINSAKKFAKNVTNSLINEKI